MVGRLGASLGLLRPRTLARTQRSVEDLTRESRDTRRTVKEILAGQQRLQETTERIIGRIDAVSEEIRTLQKQVSTLTLRESQLRAVMRADADLEDELGELPAILDERRIGEHMQAAVAAAEFHLTPFPYTIVQNVLPDDFYAALLRGIPPVELFGDKPFNKQQLKVPFAIAPEYSRRVWSFFVRAALRALQPAIVDKFREPLEEWIVSNWPSMAADPFGHPMEFNTADGRIMLRGRGYRIPPHRDPKWGFITCLLYLVRETDSESWGTQLYTVEGDEVARGAAPHWIDASRCRLVADVPFKRNTMLVFLNSVGAHGAEIPMTAEPADLTRYLYQCRVGPSSQAIRRLMSMLPEERVPLWAGKLTDY